MEMVEMMEMMEMSEPEPVGWGVGRPALLGPPLALDGGEGPVPVPQAEVIWGLLPPDNVEHVPLDHVRPLAELARLLGPVLDGGEGPVPVPQAEVIRGVGHLALLGPVLRL